MSTEDKYEGYEEALKDVIALAEQKGVDYQTAKELLEIVQELKEDRLGQD